MDGAPPAKATTASGRRRLLVGLRKAGWAIVAASLAGCAGWPGGEALRVTLVDASALPGEGMELRLALKLRVQNPNAAAIEFQGVSVTLDLRGSTLASGVSPEAGTVPGYAERVITVPVSVSALAALRQVLDVVGGETGRGFDYVLRGRLGGGLTGYPFEARGTLELPKGWSSTTP
jgi:hypothetical protein